MRDLKDRPNQIGHFASPEDVAHEAAWAKFAQMPSSNPSDIVHAIFRAFREDAIRVERHTHGERCCAECGYHVRLHRGCILR